MSVKIVIDTNVFIGAIISSQGLNRQLIRCCLQRKYQPLMGNALFAEYESVMERAEIIARCPLDRTEIIDLLAAFVSVSEWVNIYYSWRPNLRDEGDNHIIELAVAGNAKIVATNNIKDFKGAKLVFPDLLILTPEQIIRS
jgi:putative PIN family toxin of toxin-antitoxin system